MFIDWINPKWQKGLSQSYKAKPFDHIVLKNFLNKEKANALEAALRKQKFFRKEADLFSFSQTYDLYTIKDLVIKEFLQLLQSKEFASWLMQMTTVKVTPGKVDAAGFVYHDTDYLLCHDDGISSRRIAYVYHMSHDFKKSHGGALALLSSNKNGPLKTVKRIKPTWNTLVLFTVSRKSHHQVEEVIGGKRLTIAGWFHE